MLSKFEKLRLLELSLMRASFELACRRAGEGLISPKGGNDDRRERLALAIQSLVERGITDVEEIADSASLVLNA